MAILFEKKGEVPVLVTEQVGEAVIQLGDGFLRVKKRFERQGHFVGLRLVAKPEEATLNSCFHVDEGLVGMGIRPVIGRGYDWRVYYVEDKKESYKD